VSSPQAAQALTNELIAWLAERPSLEPDDIVPALLITAVKIAVHYKRGTADELTENLIILVRSVCREESEKRERKIN
jgi:hypothetical protein